MHIVIIYAASGKNGHCEGVMRVIWVEPHTHLWHSFWPNIEIVIVSLYKHENTIQDENNGMLMITKVSVSFLSIDDAVFK